MSLEEYYALVEQYKNDADPSDAAFHAWQERLHQASLLLTEEDHLRAISKLPPGAPLPVPVRTMPSDDPFEPA